MKKDCSTLFLLTAITFATVLCFSCSNKDDDDSLPTTKVCSLEKEGVIMTFCLLNSKGDTTVTFSEGEEIIFDLNLENTTEQPIILPQGPSFLGYNTFRIFTEEGVDCGVSWTYPLVWTYEMEYLWPLIPKHYLCPWYNDDVLKATYPFIFSPSTKRLKSGTYFTEAYCHLNNETILYCKLLFNIE